MADLVRLKRRLSDVTSGKAKLERFIKADPTSVRVEGWRKRVAEYDAAIPVYTKLIAELEAKQPAPESVKRKS